jgi:hypothetical protein
MLSIAADGCLEDACLAVVRLTSRSLTTSVPLYSACTVGMSECRLVLLYRPLSALVVLPAQGTFLIWKLLQSCHVRCVTSKQNLGKMTSYKITHLSALNTTCAAYLPTCLTRYRHTLM